MSLRIVVPARQGSKGFPLKNQKLFDFTANSIPKKNAGDVYVTSDDEVILKMAKAKKFNVFERAESLAGDKVSMRDVLINLANNEKFHPEDTIIMLYLTYPKRKWSEVMDALTFYQKANAKSMLCRLPWKGTNPALCLEALGPHQGRQLFKNDIFRRQDNPSVFELSHYIYIAEVREIHRVNRNLYNENTKFFPIEKAVLNVDTEAEFKKLK